MPCGWMYEEWNLHVVMLLFSDERMRGDIHES